MKYFTVDRFEGRYAVCEMENKKTRQIELEVLPKNLKEGDVLVLLDNGSYAVDLKETEVRRKKAVELTKRLFNK